MPYSIHLKQSVTVHIVVDFAIHSHVISLSTFRYGLLLLYVEGAVASWLVRLSLDRVVRVRALARDIVLCSWVRHFTLTVPLSTQEYKWVPANCWGKPNKLLGSDLRWTSIPSRGSRNTPSHFMLWKPG